MIDPDARDSWQSLIAKLRGFVARRVERSAADDVLQDVLLRIQRGLPRLRDSQRFGPWVYRVAAHTVADHLRGRAARRAMEAGASAASSEEASDGGAQEDGGVRQELLTCLAGFVTRLPAPYRQAITLTELDGLRQQEAAAMLHLSTSGMKARVQRGRRQLRAMFLECCVLGQDARDRVVNCEPRADATGCAKDRGGCSSTL